MSKNKEKKEKNQKILGKISLRLKSCYFFLKKSILFSRTAKLFVNENALK